MAMTDSLSDEFYGRTPPGRDDDWSINTVAKRAVVGRERDTVCDMTGETIPANTHHLLVTIRRPGRPQPEVETVVLRDEATLREWIEKERDRR